MRTTSRIDAIERRLKAAEPKAVPFVLIPEDLSFLYESDADRERARNFRDSGAKAAYGIRL